MPFRSEAQKRYLWKHHPEIARRWAAEEHGRPSPAETRRKVVEALVRQRRPRHPR